MARGETQPHAGMESVVCGGGCFWNVEQKFRRLYGVVDTEVGFAGGTVVSPSSGQVQGGTTGHAEVVRVYYNTGLVSLETLLNYFFNKVHDPTSLNFQGNDSGPQYRSVIYVVSDEQLATARAAVEKLRSSGVDVKTTVAKGIPFYRAEEDQQRYNSLSKRWSRAVDTCIVS
mmetsp:Transcript_50459/g.124050  ORF Transcript_50459/g.124050 Transcript_50459/m.124050 type:complete len:172 (-) Transcript_50459:563-1078(-)